MTGRALAVAWAVLATASCSRPAEMREMTVTAYCPGRCCNGHWGGRFTGRTASGTWPRPPNPGLLSVDSVLRPWMIPVRIALPWLILPRDGTLAADTDFYPFGTRLHVPGYGWGVVEDRGGAIQGPERLDVFLRLHGQTERWGRRRLAVEIER